jgi:hypothetical protein
MFRKFIVLPVAFLAFACSKDKPVDAALNSDLSTAAQANPTAVQDSISAAERLNGTTGSSPVRTRTVTHTVYRTAPSGSVSSSGTSTPTTVQRNTKRDAAIGAAAGAVIGATTSKNKVQGGVIGAIAGGVLGGVIGNNVDVKKKY